VHSLPYLIGSNGTSQMTPAPDRDRDASWLLLFRLQLFLDLPILLSRRPCGFYLILISGRVPSLLCVSLATIAPIKSQDGVLGLKTRKLILVAERLFQRLIRHRQLRHHRQQERRRRPWFDFSSGYGPSSRSGIHQLLSLVHRHEVGQTISRKLLIKRRSNYELHKIKRAS
jgi:hypothetical protein